MRSFDYAGEGFYFVTFCTFEKRRILGTISDEGMKMNSFGRIVEEEWLKTAICRSKVSLDAHVVMPNHFHGILAIVSARPSLQRPTSPVASTTLVPGSLGAAVGQVKSAAARRINALRGTPGATVWQRGYYERIIRDDWELEAIREYIERNPLTWDSDRFYAP